MGLGGRGHAHGREQVPAQHYQASVGQAVGLETEDAGGVQAGGGRHPCHGRARRLVPALRAVGDLDPAGSRDRRVGGHQLQALVVDGELVDDGAVEPGGQQELGQRDRDLDQLESAYNVVSANNK